MTVILDSNGTVLEVGMRVLDKDGNEEGTITKLTDADGDVNEYGRPVPLGPYVYVHYDDCPDDSMDECWTTRWNATGPWDDHVEEYTCDDVTVKGADSEGPERAALLALVRWLGKTPNVSLPLDVHAQVRKALGSDFYKTVEQDGREPDGQRVGDGGRILPTNR